MAINIIQAEDIVENHFDDADVDFLLAVRQGIALHDAEDAHLKVMKEHDLVDILPFDHPRANNSIMGVVPNENGNKVLNYLDDRKRAEYQTPIYTDITDGNQTESVVAAQDVSKDDAPGEGIPADDPRNVDPDVAAAERSASEAEDKDLEPTDENSGRDGSEEPDRVRGKDRKRRG